MFDFGRFGPPQFCTFPAIFFLSWREKKKSPGCLEMTREVCFRHRPELFVFTISILDVSRHIYLSSITFRHYLIFHSHQNINSFLGAAPAAQSWSEKFKRAFCPTETQNESPEQS